jgi:hypothetical protein
LAEASRRAFGTGQAFVEFDGATQEVAGGGWEFHLALYTPKRQWNDLESEESLWKARLAGAGGADVSPLRVEMLEKTDKSPVQYPYVTKWTREYRLVFPAPEGGSGARPPTLVLAGPLGQLRFEF